MKQFTFLFIIGWCVATILASCGVQTPLGLIKGGEITTLSGKKILAYRGIPYAEPPVGKLRFGAPVPRKPWEGILVADHDRCECPQLHDGVVRGCEDCLHLNVYTPERNPKKLLPVIVYLHSGYYTSKNDSASFAGPNYLLDKDIVLVTFQYRLSVLGYISTGDGAAPGNYGLKDQLLALKWVKQHIKIFGGDENEITLYGEGAGSESANLHILITESQKIIKRLICASGTVLTPRAISVGPSYHDKAKKVAEHLKCPTNDSHKMIDCLRNVSYTEIIKVSLEVFDEIDIATHRTWRPTKEPKVPGALLTETPETLIQEKKWKNTTLIIGDVRDEGTFFTLNLVKQPKLYELCRKDPVAVIKRFLEYYPPLDGMNLTDIAIKVKNHYLGTVVPKSKEEFIRKFTLLVTEFFYSFTTDQCRHYLQKTESSSVFSYIFDYHGTITPTLPFEGELRERGCGHGADLLSIFPISGAYIGPQYSSLKRSENDYKIIDICVDLWTSFAKDGVPTSSKLKNSHLWQPQKKSDKHLKIGNGKSIEVTLEEKYADQNGVDFWYHNVPTYCLN